MSMTDRDKKIIALLVPLVLIGVYWFLVFSPKREESAAIQEQVAQAQNEQQTAESQAAGLSGAKQGFTDDYTTVVRLGKAVPSTVDMPSLILQLDRAARGTQISFDKIATGERTAVPQAAAASQPTDGGATTPPVEGAASPAGQAAETADGAVKDANATNTENAAAANGAATTPASGESSNAPGLESIPLDFSFEGTFFDLADFFHRMKRFVKVANEDVVVRGRLITIDSVKFNSEQDSFPFLKAEVHATAYLAPKAEGVSAGATPNGPSATATPATPASSGAPATPPAPTPATSAPAATVK